LGLQLTNEANEGSDEFSERQHVFRLPERDQSIVLNEVVRAKRGQICIVDNGDVKAHVSGWPIACYVVPGGDTQLMPNL